jgi:hypothetical protein
MEIYRLQLIHLTVLSGQDHLNDITKQIIYLFSIFLFLINYNFYFHNNIYEICVIYKNIKKIIIILSLNILITNYTHPSSK